MEKALRYIKIGSDAGARLAIGGKRCQEGDCAKGYYIEPTIFTDAPLT